MVTNSVIPFETSFSNLFVKIEIDDNIEIYDIWDVYSVISKFSGKTNYYEKYVIPEGKRLDKLSNDFYGTPNLWWFLLLSNDIIDPFTAFDLSEIGEEKIIKVIKAQFISEIFYAIRKAKLEK